MRARRALRASALLLLGAARARVDDVTDLDESNMAKALELAAVAVVNFHAPWCAHCARFDPEYAAAARLVRDTDDVDFFRLDAAGAKATADRYGVEGYPHVKLFRHGRAADDYDGPNEAQALARWTRKRARPSARRLESWSDARAFLGSLLDETGGSLSGLVLGVFADASSPAAETFSSVASTDDGDDVEFALTTRPDLVAEALRGAPAGNATDRVVVLGAEGDAVAQLPLDETTPARKIAAFVASALQPVVTRFDSATAPGLFHSERGPKVHALLFVDEASKKSVATADAFSRVAQLERDRVRHVVVPATEARVLKHFDLEARYDLPTVVLADLRGLEPPRPGDGADASVKRGRARAFRLKDWDATASPDDSDALRRFTAALFQDDLAAPFLRSETPPRGDAAEAARAASAAGQVAVLVGKTFDDVVTAARTDPGDDRDFFVLFHAPWCGHCVAMAPAWEQLARLYQPVDSIVVASMDATKNEIDVDGVAVLGFPTIYFFPADAARPPVEYEHAVDVDSFSRFLKETGSKAFDAGGLRGGGELKDEL